MNSSNDAPVIQAYCEKLLCGIFHNWEENFLTTI